MYKRWNIRRIALWIFLTMQIVLVVLYFATQNENSANLMEPNLNNPISFISTSLRNNTRSQITFYTEKNKFILRSKYVEDLYENFNTSLCYKSGTDIKLMKRSKDAHWKCLCLPGWHGNNCGQPEVIWRALLTYKKPQLIAGPRRIQRRLVHFTEIDIISAEFVEITLYELRDVADLFIIFDYSSDLSIKNKLSSGFLRDLYNKILYITGANYNSAWKKAKRVIKNLRDDDIFFINNPFEIPNARALQFLKLYNEWPEPLTLRLRWSVYGFFWKHPEKTILTTRGCTIKYLYEALDNNLDSLKSKFISNDNQGFIVGDLNHFGGWFCEFCIEPTLIISSLQINLVNNSIMTDKLGSKKIDVAYLEDLIENGVYLDGKMELVRAHRSNENYYAPTFVSNNSWKYDWLLTNLYSKMDYY